LTGRKAVASGWAALTWDDLDAWAGSHSVSRRRSYERQGRVQNLAVSEAIGVIEAKPDDHTGAELPSARYTLGLGK
jgi:hypothetical protein